MPTDFLDIATAVPPTRAEIEQRIVERITAGAALPQLDAATVFGLGPGQLQALTREDATLVLQYERQAWALFTSLGLAVKHYERALAIINDNGTLATSNSALRAVRLANTAVSVHGRYLALISTDVPDSPLWQQIPDGWIRLIVPVNGTTERLPFAGFRFSALPDTAPEGWQPLYDEAEHLLGWVQGTTIRLRFHPFLAPNHRFTVARATDRQAALQQVIERALPLLEGEARDDALPPFLTEWRNTLQTTEAVCEAIRTSTERLTADTTQLADQHRRMEHQVSELRRQLQQAETGLTTAAEELAAIPALEAAVAERARLSISTIHEQLTAIGELAQVADVQMVRRHFAYHTHSAAFAITTHPLLLDCGTDGLRNIGPVVFLLPVSGVPDPVLEVPTNQRVAHPDVTAYGAIEWGNSSVPLAQALGSDNYLAATRVICSHLARAISANGNTRRFPAATGDAGYQLPTV
jgi:hypothetical protein